jgi:carbamoyltransferase
MPRTILGISAYYHDSASALLVDGNIHAAAQEERFSREKNAAAFPSGAIDYCLSSAGLLPADLDAVVFYDKPLVKFERLLNSALYAAPLGFPFFRAAMPTWIREKLWLPGRLRKRLPGAGEYLFASHHHSHAAAAFYPSPFERAAILTIDGVGEWSTCSFGVGHGRDIDLHKELCFPNSLGLLYSAFTAYLGFRVNEGEYKVMGLAPYGTPRYVDLIFDRLVKRNADGSFALNMNYFGFLTGLAMFNRRFEKLLGGPARRPDAELTARHLDIAASIQRVAEELVLELARHVHRFTGESCLCLAGGVALNSVANGRLLREGPFEKIWIQPAAGDAGSALGGAYLGHLALGGELPAKNDSDLMQGALLGPEYDDQDIIEALTAVGLKWVQLDKVDLLARTVAALAAGKIGGWFQGRMEFGPRALGNRSILADARRPEMQRLLNQKIKFREGFRPFAPVVLAERAGEYFDLSVESPYMLLVCPVAEKQRHTVPPLEGLAKLNQVRSTVPAITHVDYSARIQTVDAVRNPLFYDLLKTFEAETGCPILVNTSFNVKDEPIVCTPQDAVNCLLQSGIDFLAIGSFWIAKDEQ